MSTELTPTGILYDDRLAKLRVLKRLWGELMMPITPEEIEAVIDAAHRFGAKVAAHSGSSAATSVAVDAGIDSIEHGYFLDRKVLRKMEKNGTWLVPEICGHQI